MLEFFKKHVAPSDAPVRRNSASIRVRTSSLGNSKVDRSLDLKQIPQTEQACGDRKQATCSYGFLRAKRDREKSVLERLSKR